MPSPQTVISWTTEHDHRPAQRTERGRLGCHDRLARLTRALVFARGFVQGCSVVSWNFFGQAYSPMGGFGMNQRPFWVFRAVQLPARIVSAEHRMYGLNYEKTWLERPGRERLRKRATTRLLDEARQLGAHGHHRPVTTVPSITGTSRPLRSRSLAPPSVSGVPSPTSRSRRSSQERS